MIYACLNIFFILGALSGTPFDARLKHIADELVNRRNSLLSTVYSREEMDETVYRPKTINSLLSTVYSREEMDENEEIHIADELVNRPNTI